MPGPSPRRWRRLAAGSKAPIPVITYRDSDWKPRAEKIEALAPGVIAPTSEQPLAATRTFGQPLLGTVGEVTAEVVQESGGRYVAGDRAGLSGLQAQYDVQLAGDVGLRVQTSGGKGLFEQPATDGADVVTTLDPGIQAAAEDALAAAELKVPGAIVAVHVPTGEVLAAANSPSTGFDRALTGRYPPGSTFKVTTAYAYLTGGITTPTSKVPCPESITVDGREFRNYAGESLSGTPTFFQNFTVSCNTAFVSLADELGRRPHERGQDAGHRGRLGRHPRRRRRVRGERAGHHRRHRRGGGIHRSGAHRGLAARARGDVGERRARHVRRAGARQGHRGHLAATPLDGGAVAQLRAMMLSVVAGGTGTAQRGAPGGPVRGKTGSAEHGTDPDVPPHVWFTGYQGDVAFAVLVEEGKSGGTVAAPSPRTSSPPRRRALGAAARVAAKGPARDTRAGPS